MGNESQFFRIRVDTLTPFIHWNQQKEISTAARSTTPGKVSLSPRQAFNGLAAFYKLNDRKHRPATLQLLLDEKDLRLHKDGLLQNTNNNYLLH